jgi:hypothetical protein
MSGAPEDVQRGPSALDEAKEFLREELKDGAVAAREIKRRAEDAGVAQFTLRQAREQIGVLSSRQSSDRGSYEWALPLPQASTSSSSHERIKEEDEVEGVRG